MGYWTTEQSRGVGVPAVRLTTHVKSSTWCGRTVVWSYIQIFSAWWVTTILYNYGATLCELRCNSYYYSFIFFINFSLVSLEKNVCGEDSQPSVFRKITSCETLGFSRDYSKTCCPDNLKTVEQSPLDLTFWKSFILIQNVQKLFPLVFPGLFFLSKEIVSAVIFAYYILNCMWITSFLRLPLGARCAPNTFDGERCLYAALTDKIRSLLKSYKAITSECMRRDSYREFLRR